MAVRAGIGLVQGRSDLEAITVGLADYPPFATPSISITMAPVDNPSRGVAPQSLIYPQNFPGGRLGLHPYPGLGSLFGYVLKGWQISATANFNSGRHFNPGLTGAPNQIATRPDVIGRAALPKSEKTLRRFFNTAAFARPAAWTYGNAGRNILVGPGTNTWDVMIGKNTRIKERLNVQFRCESFNFFNHPSYTGINATFGSSAFGQVNGVNSGRTFQLGMKLVF